MYSMPMPPLPHLDIAEQRKLQLMIPRPWFLRCGCGVSSMAITTTNPDEARAAAIRESGFRQVGDMLLCRKCAKRSTRG